MLRPYKMTTLAMAAVLFAATPADAGFLHNMKLHSKKLYTNAFRTMLNNPFKTGIATLTTLGGIKLGYDAICKNENIDFEIETFA